jgi:integral membrane protein
LTESSAPYARIGKPSFAALLKGSMEGALVRYRVMTFIVGSALIVLVFLGVPLQVWGHFDLVAKVEGTIHGYLYLVYLFTAADVARRAHWRLGRILAVVLSGFVPFLAFVVEHRVYRQMQQEWTIDPSGAYVEVAKAGGVTADHLAADRSGDDRTVDGVSTDGG